MRVATDAGSAGKARHASWLALVLAGQHRQRVVVEERGWASDELGRRRLFRVLGVERGLGQGQSCLVRANAVCSVCVCVCVHCVCVCVR